MKLMKEAPLFCKRGLYQFLLCCFLPVVIHFFGFGHFSGVYGLVTGLTIISACIGGILFGLPAALGFFAGHTLTYCFADVMSLELLLAGFAGAMFSYGSYRLWYGYGSEKATMYVYNSRTLFKFIINSMGLFLSIVLVMIPIFYSVYHDYALYYVYGYVILGAFFIVFAGVPILLFLTMLMPFRFYRQRAVVQAGRKNRIVSGVLLALLCTGMWIGIQVKMIPLETSLWAIPFLGGWWLYTISIPSKYETDDEEYRGVPSITFRFLMKLYVTMATVVILYISMTIYSNKENFEFIFQQMSICLVIFLPAICVFMYRAEKRFLGRLQNFHKLVEDYISSGNLDRIIAKGDEKEYNKLDSYDELEVLQYSLGRMGKDIKTYISNIDAIVKKHQLYDTEMRIATSIQQGVLPDLDVIRPMLADYKIFGGMKAAKSVGGDMYDAFFVNKDTLLIMVADVAGKGVPASIFMMVTQALIKQNSIWLSPDSSVAATNDMLVAHNDECLFVTMWLGVLNLTTGSLKYINAGHNPPLLFSKKGDSMQWLEDLSGPVLGLMDGMTYQVYEMTLEKGDKLLLYTDGLNEAENAKGEFYGNERLIKAFERANNPQEIISDIEEFVDGAEQSDDMTYLWFERINGGEMQ